MQYFTSDTHFYHADLLGDNDFAPRLFPDVETMNQAIVDHWNARVTDQDTAQHRLNDRLYPDPSHGHIHHYAVNVKENINVGVDTPEVDYLDHPVPFGTPFSLAEIEQMVDGKAIDFAKRQ